MKLLLVLLLIGGCCPKKPVDKPKEVVPPVVEKTIEVQAGSCYRYPNRNQQDVHMKVIRTYNKGGFYAEFIVEKVIFSDVHEFSQGVRHLKEIDCYLFEDLKNISKPNNG